MASQGSDTRIITPEAVVLDLQPASVGSRGAALALDVCILFLGNLLLFLAESAFGFSGFVDGWFAIAVLLLLGFAAQFGYPIGFEVLWGGRTPGKAALGLRVVTAEGAPVGVRHATIRAAVGLLELTATVGALAAITSLLSPRGQRLGDLAAGTLVVRERRATSNPIAVASFAPPPGLESYTASLDVSAVGPADYATIRDLLRRAPSLTPAARVAVAGQVATALRPRVAPPPPDGLDAERWLTCVAAAVQSRSTPVVVPPLAATAPDTWGVARPRPAESRDAPVAGDRGDVVPPG